MAKMKIKGVEYEIADSVAPAVLMLIQENEGLTTKVEDGKKELSKVQAFADAEHEKSEELKKKMEDDEDEDEKKEKKIEDAANKRLDVLLAASHIVKDYDPSGKSLDEIKRDVVTDVLPDFDFSDKDDSYIQARFDILVEDSKKSGQHKMNDALAGIQGDVDVNDAVSVARANKMKRSQDAYKGGK